MQPAPRRELRQVALLAALFALGYSAYALLRHLHYGSGLDVGLFSQAEFHYGRLEAPFSTFKGIDLLGDHFHPIVALLAPASWLGADVNGLLVAQGALLGASIVPVWMFARQRLERWPALAIALAYALFWGVWGGAGFEFHELAFAPLLVALGVLLGERRSWLPFAAVMALLLLVKEDMALLVAFFGIWLLSRREWRAGAIVALGGLAAYLVITGVVIPGLGDGHDFAYWSYGRIGTDLPDAAGNVALHPWLPFQVAFDDGEKVRTMAAMLVPFLALPLLSRVSILAIPLVAERMLSTNPVYWTSSRHYTLTLAPILAMAAAAGLANAASRLPVERRGRALAAAAVAILALSLVANESRARTLRQLHYYAHDPSWAPGARAAVGRVPSGASVASQDFVYPHLAARSVADVIRPGMADTAYLVVNPFVESGAATGNPAGFAGFGDQLRSRLPAYRAMWERDGWLVLRRRRPGETGRGDALDAGTCRRLARRAATEGTQGDAAATVAVLCRRAGR